MGDSRVGDPGDNRAASDLSACAAQAGGEANAPAGTRRRRAALYGLVAIAFGLGAATTVLYYASRRRQERAMRKLRSNLALAESRAAELAEALACEKVLRETAEETAKRYHNLISSLREGDEDARQKYARSERERREVTALAEEKSHELIQRHNRIVELQEQVERLMRERSEGKEAAFQREKGLRRIYEAEVRNERQRREELEKKLAVLDEIEGLRRELSRLADKMQELVRKGALSSE